MMLKVEGLGNPSVRYTTGTNLFIILLEFPNKGCKANNYLKDGELSYLSMYLVFIAHLDKVTTNSNLSCPIQLTTYHYLKWSYMLMINRTK
jgi:hypothetical protein